MYNMQVYYSEETVQWGMSLLSEVELLGPCPTYEIFTWNFSRPHEEKFHQIFDNENNVGPVPLMKFSHDTSA